MVRDFGPAEEFARAFKQRLAELDHLADRVLAGGVDRVTSFTELVRALGPATPVAARKADAS